MEDGGDCIILVVKGVKAGEFSLVVVVFEKAFVLEHRRVCAEEQKSGELAEFRSLLALKSICVETGEGAKKQKLFGVRQW